MSRVEKDGEVLHIESGYSVTDSEHVWREKVDKKSGKTFYINQGTNEKKWTLPPAATAPKKKASVEAQGGPPSTAGQGPLSAPFSIGSMLTSFVPTPVTPVTPIASESKKKPKTEAKKSKKKAATPVPSSGEGNVEDAGANGTEDGAKKVSKKKKKGSTVSKKKGATKAKDKVNADEIIAQGSTSDASGVSEQQANDSDSSDSSNNSADEQDVRDTSTNNAGSDEDTDDDSTTTPARKKSIPNPFSPSARSDQSIMSPGGEHRQRVVKFVTEGDDTSNNSDIQEEVGSLSRSYASPSPQGGSDIQDEVGSPSRSYASPSPGSAASPSQGSACVPVSAASSVDNSGRRSGSAASDSSSAVSVETFSSLNSSSPTAKKATSGDSTTSTSSASSPSASARSTTNNTVTTDEGRQQREESTGSSSINSPAAASDSFATRLFDSPVITAPNESLAATAYSPFILSSRRQDDATDFNDYGFNEGQYLPDERPTTLAQQKLAAVAPLQPNEAARQPLPSLPAHRVREKSPESIAAEQLAEEERQRVRLQAVLSAARQDPFANNDAPVGTPPPSTSSRTELQIPSDKPRASSFGALYDSDEVAGNAMLPSIMSSMLEPRVTSYNTFALDENRAQSQDYVSARAEPVVDVGRQPGLEVMPSAASGLGHSPDEQRRRSTDRDLVEDMVERLLARDVVKPAPVPVARRGEVGALDVDELLETFSKESHLRPVTVKAAATVGSTIVTGGIADRREAPSASSLAEIREARLAALAKPKGTSASKTLKPRSSPSRNGASTSSFGGSGVQTTPRYPSSFAPLRMSSRERSESPSSRRALVDDSRHQSMQSTKTAETGNGSPQLASSSSHIKATARDEGTAALSSETQFVGKLASTTAAATITTSRAEMAPHADSTPGRATVEPSAASSFFNGHPHSSPVTVIYASPPTWGQPPQGNDNKESERLHLHRDNVGTPKEQEGVMSELERGLSEFVAMMKHRHSPSRDVGVQFTSKVNVRQADSETVHRAPTVTSRREIADEVLRRRVVSRKSMASLRVAAMFEKRPLSSYTHRSSLLSNVAAFFTPQEKTMMSNYSKKLEETSAKAQRLRRQCAAWDEAHAGENPSHPFSQSLQTVRERVQSQEREHLRTLETQWQYFLMSLDTQPMGTLDPSLCQL